MQHSAHATQPSSMITTMPPAHAAAASSTASSARSTAAVPDLAPLFARLKAKLHTRKQQQQHQHQSSNPSIQVVPFADVPRCDSPLCALHDDRIGESNPGLISSPSQLDFAAQMPFEVRSAISLLSRSLERSMHTLTKRVVQSESAASAAIAEARASQLADRQRAADGDDRFIRLQEQMLFERREGERREDRIGALEAAVHSLQQRLAAISASSASALSSQLNAAPIQVPLHRPQHESAAPAALLSPQQPRLDHAPPAASAAAAVSPILPPAAQAATSASHVPARIVPGLKRVQSDKSLFDRLRDEAEQTAGNPPPRSQPPNAVPSSAPPPPIASALNPVATAAVNSDSDNDDAPAARWSPQQRSISSPTVTATGVSSVPQTPAAHASLSPPLIPMSSPPPSRSAAGSDRCVQPPPRPSKAAGKSSATKPKSKVKPEKKKARRRISYSQRFNSNSESSEEDDGSNYSGSSSDDEGEAQGEGSGEDEKPAARSRTSQAAAPKSKAKSPVHAQSASASSAAASKPEGAPTTALGRKRKKPAAAATSTAPAVASVSTLNLSFSQGAPPSLSQSAPFEDDSGGFTPIIMSQSDQFGETFRMLRTRKTRVDYAAMDPRLEKAIAAGSRGRR